MRDANRKAMFAKRNSGFKLNDIVKIKENNPQEMAGEYAFITKIEKTNDKKDFVYTVKTLHGNKKWSYYDSELEK